MTPLRMKIKKSIHELENKTTFKDLRVSPLTILEKNFMKNVLNLFNNSFRFFTIQIDTSD